MQKSIGKRFGIVGLCVAEMWEFIRKWPGVVGLCTVLAISLVVMSLSGCDEEFNRSVRKDRKVTDQQLQHYQIVQPVPMFDYSIPRDILVQIYSVLTTKAVATYTVVTDDFGGLFCEGPTIGFPIPADVQLTNPLQSLYNSGGSVVEQMEPNGLYSSKNTNGTYVLWVQEDGSVAPGYYELRANAFMYPVVKVEGKGWVRASGSEASTTINMEKIKRTTKELGTIIGVK